ncbi:MAG: hypothetical protein JW997_07175 [Actinobacteria bacterium]|nr:hypothetical protein [Actinomycetota bacterium]
MSSVEKYIKAAKDLVIKSSEENIEEKILKRISNVNEEDSKLLDEKFLEYMKRINSRPYIFSEWILNNPLKLSLIILSTAAIAAVIYFIYREKK